MIANITPEPNASPDVFVTEDYERRTLNLAVEALDDIAELDESAVCIKWMSLEGMLAGRALAPKKGEKAVPLLYVFFSEVVAKQKNLPRIHIDSQGHQWPAHAVCLAKLPSGNLLEGEKLRAAIRDDIEIFLRKYDLSTTHRPSTVS